MADVEIIRGDITKQLVDAIVNAANASLLGGGGVDGAIHYAAGPGLLQECRTLGGCKVGEAKITGGHNLPARFVIHTVGPIYNEEEAAERATLLANCYRNSIRIANQHEVQSLAFPSISTGAFGYPIEKACRTALQTVQEELQRDSKLERVIFVTFSYGDFLQYQVAYTEIFK